MPKSKSCHHLLVEGQHSLQGDKHKKHIPGHHQYRDREVHTVHAQCRKSKGYWNSVCCVLYYSCRRKCVFIVYRLVIDAKPERVMMQPAENIWACSRIFRLLQHQWLARDILHQAQGVFYVFVFPAGTDFYWWTPLRAESSEKTKTRKTPWREWGHSPAASLPLWAYKSYALVGLSARLQQEQQAEVE